LGIDTQTRRPFLSIPVANRMIDYEEYYLLTAAQLEEFEENDEAALAFANACRDRKNDDLLILEPGSDRGVAV
jgi:hypothetical protein